MEKGKKQTKEIANRLSATADQVTLVEAPTTCPHTVLGHHLCLVPAGHFLLCRQAGLLNLPVLE